MIQCGIVRTNQICICMKNTGGNEVGLNHFSFYRVCPIDPVKVPNKCLTKAPMPRTISTTDKFTCRSELPKEPVLAGNKSLFSLKSISLDSSAKSATQQQQDEDIERSNHFFETGHAPKAKTENASTLVYLIANLIKGFVQHKRETRFELCFKWLHLCVNPRFFRLAFDLIKLRDREVLRLLAPTICDNLHQALVFGLDIASVVSSEELQQA